MPLFKRKSVLLARDDLIISFCELWINLRSRAEQSSIFFIVLTLEMQRVSFVNLLVCHASFCAVKG